MLSAWTSPAGVSTSGRGHHCWVHLPALARRATARRDRPSLAPRELRHLRPLRIGIRFGRGRIASSLVLAVRRRGVRDNARDEPAEYAGDLLVRVLVALHRSAEHEDATAPRSVRKGHNEELSCLGGDPWTKSALSDTDEPLLMERLGERCVL